MDHRVKPGGDEEEAAINPPNRSVNTLAFGKPGLIVSPALVPRTN
jgi:hypothetical protein